MIEKKSRTIDAVVVLAIRKHQAEPLPRVLVIEPTARCNMRCIMYEPPQRGHRVRDMDTKLFKEILKESKRYGTRDYLIFSGWRGEPLLHKNIIEMVDYIKSKRVAKKVQLETNGLMLSKELSKKLLKAGLDIIIIGFDGATKKTYETIRVGSSFSRLVNNIEELISQKQELNRTTKIILRTVKLSINKKEIPQIKKVWKDRVNDIVILEDGRKEMEKNQKRRYPCLSLFSIMCINVKGKVRLCKCKSDFVSQFTKKYSLKDIWKGLEFNTLRDHHLKGRYDLIASCHNCFNWNVENFIHLL